MTLIKQAMHSGAAWVEADTPIVELAEKMRDMDVGAIPVGENDKLIGMVTDRDIVCRGVLKSGTNLDLTARDVMSESIVYCLSEEPLVNATHTMEEKRIRRLPVLDSEKRLVGMLSLGDVAQVASMQLIRNVVRAVTGHHV